MADPSCTARWHGPSNYAWLRGCSCPDTVAARKAWMAAHIVRKRSRNRFTSRVMFDLADVEIAVARVRSGQPVPVLSVPERRHVIAVLVGDGWTTARIAEALRLSTRAVDRHRARARGSREAP